MGKEFFLILITMLVFSSCVQPHAIGDGSGTDMVSVPFVRTRSGHILVTVEINGKKAYLIIDTGASSSIIHMGRIEYLGLESRDKKCKASGIGTSTYDMKEVLVPMMTLNSVSYSNPEFNGVDLYHIEQIDYNQTLDGIIGSDFLEKHKAIIDYKNKSLLLKKPI